MHRDSIIHVGAMVEEENERGWAGRECLTEAVEYFIQMKENSRERSGKVSNLCCDGQMEMQQQLLHSA